MRKKLMKFLEKSEGNSVKDRQPHFIFSAENAVHPENNKLKLSHKETLDFLRKKGYKAEEMDGKYGSPERSILVHNVQEEAIPHLHDLARDLGQDSGIYSDGYNHEMHYYHGENSGKYVKGQGTEFHKRPPKDFYSLMGDGTLFTHNFDFSKFHNKKALAKTEIQKSAAEDIEEHSEPNTPNLLTHRGVSVESNPNIKANTKSVLDTNTGTLHTPKGNFKLHMPDRGDKDYHSILNSPSIQGIHTNAMKNWFKLNSIHKAGQQLPEEIIAHANIFSILSANNPVPQQELAYSRLVDTMKELKLDPTHPNFAEAMARGGAGREHWKGQDNPQEFPEHAQEYWKGQANAAITQKNVSKTTGRQPGDVVAIGGMNSFSDRLSKYPNTHKYISDLVHSFGGDTRSIVSQMMADKSNSKLPKDHPMKQGVGLGSKTSRYAVSMMGGGNSVIPDTHFVRHIFGLDANTDSSTIAYLKNTLWNPKNHGVLNDLDEYYHENHPAVQHVQNEYFNGKKDPNAIFPAFWLHWLSISPHEKQMNIGKPHASKNLTDHTPYWDTAQKILDKYDLSSLKKSEDKSEVSVPIRTAAAALELEHKLGAAPASMIYYSHLLPHLLQKKAKPFEMHKAEDVLMKSPIVAEYADEVSSSSDVHHKMIINGNHIKSTKVGGHIVHTAVSSDNDHYHYITENGRPKGKVAAFVNVQNIKDWDNGGEYPAITTSVTEAPHRRKGMSSALTRHAANFHDDIYSDEVVSPAENKKWQKLGAKIAPFNPEPVESEEEADTARMMGAGDPYSNDNSYFRHKLPATKKAEDEYLEHYSAKQGLKTINPFHMGSGVDSTQRASKNRASKFSFYYPQGYKDPEGLVTGQSKSKYTVKVPEHHNVYDSKIHGSDIINQVKDENQGVFHLDNFVSKLKDAGYHGFKSRPQGIEMVAMFHEMPVVQEHPVQPFKFNKSEDLQKGAMKRIAPFSPEHSVDDEEKNAVTGWQESANPNDRVEVPKIDPNAKKRALHKLHVRTQVRKNPKTGGREFLLHRGIGPNELDQHKDGKTQYTNHTRSSWTPHHETAEGFAGDEAKNYNSIYPEREQHGPKTISAWIPEKNIYSVPNQILHPEDNPHPHEHEVIVNHYSDDIFEHANPESVETSKRNIEIAPINIDEAITSRGKMGGSWLGREHSDKFFRDSIKTRVKKSEVLKKAEPFMPKISKVSLNSQHGAHIADAYHNMEHNPEHPEVKEAYGALINETKNQYKNIMNSGVKFSPIQPGADNPYKNSKDLHHDIANNKHMWYFPTEQGYGSKENDQFKNHPMLQETEFEVGGKKLLANDLFRIVHDINGHHKGGMTGFGPKGEHKAYLTHKQMYSPNAQKALASETLGQNSWVNFGPHGDHNRSKPHETIYADQKAGLLPKHIINGDWHSSEDVKKSEEIDLMKDIGPIKFNLKGVSTRADQEVRSIKTPRQAEIARRTILHQQRRANPELGEMERVNENVAGPLVGLVNSTKEYEGGKKKTKGIRGFLSKLPSKNKDPKEAKRQEQQKEVDSGLYSGFSINLPQSPESPQTFVAGQHFGGPVAQHEAHHHMLGQIGSKYGEDARQKTVDRLVNHIHPSDKMELMRTLHHNYGYDPHDNRFNEEVLNHVHDILTHTPSREAFMRNTGATQEHLSRMKSSWKSIGKDAKNITEDFFKHEELEKNMKGIRAGIISAVAAGTLHSATPAIAEQSTMQTQPSITQPDQVIRHDQQFKEENNKNHILNAISMVESSGGKNIEHERLPANSIHRGERAFGKYGLTPLLIRETIGAHKDLSRKYGHLKQLKGDQFHEQMDEHPELEGIIASRHYDRVARKFGHDPAKVGYAWLNGITGTAKAVRDKKDINNHWHVQKILNAFKDSKNGR